MAALSTRRVKVHNSQTIPSTNPTKKLTSSINDGLAKFKRLVAFLLLGRFTFSLVIFIDRFREQLLDVRIEADAKVRVDGCDTLLQLGEERHLICRFQIRCASSIVGGVAWTLRSTGNE